MIPSLPTARFVSFSLRPLLRMAGVLLAVVSLGGGALQAQEKKQLPGMSEEIQVKSAKELSIKAASGEDVAVLDQSGVAEDSAGNRVQDHHNGWLTLSTDKVEGDVIKVKGKYYIPGSATVPAKGIRFTVRKRQPNRIAQFADVTLPVETAVDQWIDFEIALPLKEDGELTRPEARFVLMLSAVPFAGPVYLDNLQVTDPQGNALWDSPEFE